MSRSVVTQKPIKPPKELEKFFDNPPLVGNEKREDYEALFLAIARDVNPTDVILWIQAREFADISWELQRERRLKAEIIKSKQTEAKASTGMAMTRSEFEYMRGKENPSAIKKRNPKPEVMEDESRSLPQAFMLGSRDIDIIDTRIASYLFRRNAVLREIERYSDVKARKMDKAVSDIIEGEFSEAAE